jgi:hypothetical protein
MYCCAMQCMFLRDGHSISKHARIICCPLGLSAVCLLASWRQYFVQRPLPAGAAFAASGPAPAPPHSSLSATLACPAPLRPAGVRACAAGAQPRHRLHLPRLPHTHPGAVQLLRIWPALHQVGGQGCGAAGVPALQLLPWVPAMPCLPHPATFCPACPPALPAFTPCLHLPVPTACLPAACPPACRGLVDFPHSVLGRAERFAEINRQLEAGAWVGRSGAGCLSDVAACLMGGLRWWVLAGAWQQWQQDLHSQRALPCR